MPKFIVLSPIKYKGERHEPDAEVEVDATAAKSLLEANVIATPAKSLLEANVIATPGKKTAREAPAS